MKSEEFLDLYRQMEELLDEKYSGKKRRYPSVIFEFLNDEDSIPFRDKLDICREIRNLLTHNAKLGGEDIVVPSAPVCAALNAVVAYLKQPPLALDFSTKGEQIFCARINQTLLKIMAHMEKFGFSHVPILENGQFIGVFSPGALLRYLLNNQGGSITEATTFAEIRSLLPLSMHSENYEFASEKLTCGEARKKFQKIREKNKRLSVIFITQNGKESERLLGMLTPWDVLGNDSFMEKSTD